MTSSITLHIDRDSVAMGDDVTSHARDVEVPTGTALSAALERAAPEIRTAGWSWVAMVGGAPAAVWSVDHGVRMLIDDVPAVEGLDVFFRYFTQIDPEWLHRRLRDGARPDRRALDDEYAPIASTRRERDLRLRERQSAERFLSPEFVAAAISLGASIDLHADTICRLDILGERWSLQRSDSMTLVYRGAGGPIAALRPTAFAECWTIAAFVAGARAARGLPAFPVVEAHPAPELSRMPGVPGEPVRWSVTGPLTAQVTGDEGVACFRLAVGRSIAEILALAPRPVAG